MDYGAVQMAIRVLAEELSARRAHSEIFDAFGSAMPEAATRYLELFSGDRASAGYALVLFDSGSSQHKNLFERYLFGDADAAHQHVARIISVISGAIVKLQGLQ